jgi:hypothetical protein
MKACDASLMKDGGKQYERGLRGRRKLHEEASNGWKRRQVGEKIEKRKEKGLVLESGRLAVDWLILERKVVSKRQYR